MDLDQVNVQIVETSDFLHELIQLHSRTLFDPELSADVDLVKLRNDILNCFADLEELNDRLVKFDGLIATEIEKLDNCKTKLISLNRRISILEGEKEKWQIKTEPLKIDTQVIPFTLHYRKLLQSYNESVGHSSNQTLISLNILNNSLSQIDLDIKNMKSLLTQLENDKKFIMEKINDSENQVKENIAIIDKDISKLQSNKKKLLIGINFAVSEQISSLAKSLFNLTINKAQDDHDDEYKEINDFSTQKEFIDSKISLLKLLLEEKKEQLSLYNEQKSSWKFCIDCIETLEKKIESTLPNLNKLQTNSWINDSIRTLNDMLSTTQSDDLKQLILNEVAVLKQALEELNR